MSCIVVKTRRDILVAFCMQRIAMTLLSNHTGGMTMLIIRIASIRFADFVYWKYFHVSERVKILPTNNIHLCYSFIPSLFHIKSYPLKKT